MIGKILFLSESFPFPFHTGGKLRTANLLIQLSRYFEIDFVCRSLDPVTPEQIEEAKRYCRTVTVFDSEGPSTAAKLGNLFTKTCNAAFLVKSADMERRVRELIAKNAYRLVFVERLYAFQYVEWMFRETERVIPVYLDMHDIERESMLYFAQIAENPLQKLHYRLEARKVKALEAKAFRHAARLLAVSERDRAEYIRFFPDTADKWLAINNGVDPEKPKLVPDRQRDKDTAIFVGSLRHPPNLHGLRWFVKNAWPAVMESKPNAKLIIVGSGEIPEEDRLLFEQTRGVDFRGYVENLYPLLKQAACMVVPLFSGSGTRMKILEAFSFLLPVVSTTVGAEGLPCRRGREILIADDVAGMKTDILTCFTEEEKTARMAEHAYRFVCADYDWNKIGEKLKTKIMEERR